MICFVCHKLRRTTGPYYKHILGDLTFLKRVDEPNKVMFAPRKTSTTPSAAPDFRFCRTAVTDILCATKMHAESEASIIDGAVAGEIFNRAPLAINH